MAVRRIVKTAAETWRYARLEIPMITASMSEEDRPDFMRSRNTPTLGPALNGVSGPRHVLLSLFPIIEREAIHEDIREDARVHDQGYTYFPGRALYSDDPAVVGCLAENQRDHVSPIRRLSREKSC